VGGGREGHGNCGAHDRRVAARSVVWCVVCFRGCVVVARERSKGTGRSACEARQGIRWGIRGHGTGRAASQKFGGQAAASLDHWRVKKRGGGGQGVVAGCWACLALAGGNQNPPGLARWCLALVGRCVGCNSGTPVDGLGAGERRHLEPGTEPGSLEKRAWVAWVVWVGVGGGTRRKKGSESRCRKDKTARGQASL
jgi:hypothetical protein